ncbi:MAG: hypothetical protein JRJ75_02250 [Deltaproteobacteria bacterium]|nr:hypothetical protein [Deltaproteobacteria bacterium]MBW1928462.1 hypothetical protein [Deltaproteobacteria bacterium]
MSFTQSDVSPIKRLLLKHPRDAFISQTVISRQWKRLGYTAPPDLRRALQEYDEFVQCLSQFVPEIYFLPQEGSVGLDSIYVRDASIVCRQGVVLCNMGKAERKSEPKAQEAFFRSLGIPIVGAITGQGTVEGGDVVWINEKTLAVGRSYRTNDEGIRQLRGLLGACIEEFIVVDLPHWRGPGDVFHLMSIISPIDHNLALVYSPLMPVRFRERLLSLSIRLIEVPDSEFETMGCNVLAIAPRKCLMISGNPITRSRLEQAEVEVYEFEGREISLKGGGGPTCLTRPLQRAF